MVQQLQTRTQLKVVQPGEGDTDLLVPGVGFAEPDWIGDVIEPYGLTSPS